MKKTLLLFGLLVCTGSAISQVVVSGISPAAVQGNYDYGYQSDAGWPQYTTANPANDNWGMSLDFNVPGTYVQAQVALVEDGTPGVNPQGIDSTHEGCSVLTNPTEIAGKIALVYRNTCSFTTKVKYAQDAGAVAVIIINREDDVNFIMTAAVGSEGPLCTIPAVLLSKTDGDFIVSQAELGPVEMLIGNKLGAFADDMGSIPENCLVSKMGTLPKFIADNGHSFQLGIELYNYGSNSNDVTVTATVDGPSGNVYSESVTGVTLASGDTLAIFNGNTYSFPVFAPASYQVGEYTVTYTIAIDGATDLSPYDNTFSNKFSVVSDGPNGGVLSLANTTAGELNSDSYPYNATSITQSYKSCMFYEDVFPGANTGVEGVSFNISSTDTVAYPLENAEIYIEAFEWNDTWVDVSAGWAGITFDLLNQVGTGSYVPSSNAEYRTQVYAPFTSTVMLNDNQRYLFCLQTYALGYSFGYDNSRNYGANYSIYSMPVSPVNIDDTWYTWWTNSTTPAIGLKMVGNVGVVENASVKGTAYPNPTTNEVTISVEAKGKASLKITDLAGRTAFEGPISLETGKTKVSVDNLENGMYLFNVTFENGQTSQFNVVKN